MLPLNTLQDRMLFVVYSLLFKTLDVFVSWRESIQESQRKSWREPIRHTSIWKIWRSSSMMSFWKNSEISNRILRSTRCYRVKRSLRELRSWRRKNQGTLLVTWSRKDIQLSKMLWRIWMMLFVWCPFLLISHSIKVFQSTPRKSKLPKTSMPSGWTIAPSVNVSRNLSFQSRESISKLSSWDKILLGLPLTVSIRDYLSISTTRLLALSWNSTQLWWGSLISNFTRTLVSVILHKNRLTILKTVISLIQKLCTLNNQLLPKSLTFKLMPISNKSASQPNSRTPQNSLLSPKSRAKLKNRENFFPNALSCFRER